MSEFQDKLENRITELNNEEKDLRNKIESEENLISTLKNEIKIIDYPKIKFFEDENLEIQKENKDDVEEQLKKVKISGYNIIKQKTEHVISFYEAKEKKAILDALLNTYDEKANDVNEAIKNSFYDINNLNKLQSEKTNYSIEMEKVENSRKLSEIESILIGESYEQICNDIKTYISSLKEAEKILSGKQKDIQDKEKGNEIISSLSDLVSGRNGLFKYKNEGNDKCPLCGATENFTKINRAEELATEAEAYLNESKSDLAILKKNEKDIKDEIDRKFNELKVFVIKHLNEKISVLSNKILTFNKYYTNTKIFFDGIVKLKIDINEDCINKIKNWKQNVDEVIKYEEKVSESIDIIKKIARNLDYSVVDDNLGIDLLKKMELDMNQLCDEKLQISNFTFELFSQKLLFLNNILKNQKVIEKEVLVKKYKDKLNKTVTKHDKFDELKRSVNTVKAKIDKNKANIEKEELESVGPYLYKIFKKIIKHTNIEEIKFNRDSSRHEGGATFADQNGNNILNILSQGQLGIFMLSYFLGNMFKRKDEIQFKIYFVDDITSSMDDMNVLSFVEVIKYQLVRGDVIGQFFFSTCNNDLEQLFIHKMKSFNINWVNFKFTSYAKGISNSESRDAINF